jgi:hypothetical protein
MKLIELLEVISEYAEVKILDTDEMELARYDGKDSIPEELNDREVDSVLDVVIYVKGAE